MTKRPEPIRVQRIDRPLPEIRAWLRQRYPRAGIRGVGIGYRRRGVHGRLTDQAVIKVVLRDKRDDVPKSQRIPRWLRIETTFLGKTVGVRLPVDIEQATEAEATRYQLESAGHVSTVSAYARWREDGADRVGVVTAGHGLWTTPGGHSRRRVVKVLTEQSCDRPIDGRVRCASHLADHGVDAALVEIDAAELGVCARRIWGDVRVLDDGELFDALSASADDDDFVGAVFRHPTVDGADLKSVAFFDEFTVSVAGWGLVTLRNVVETQGIRAVFEPGTSGAGVVTDDGERALGIHAICLDPNVWMRGMATSFATARAWLSEAMGTPVELFWDDEVG